MTAQFIEVILQGLKPSCKWCGSKNEVKPYKVLDTPYNLCLECRLKAGERFDVEVERGLK